MTTAPFDPDPNPEIVPSGDPEVNPIAPGEIPEPSIPDTQPDGAP